MTPDVANTRDPKLTLALRKTHKDRVFALAVGGTAIVVALGISAWAFQLFGVAHPVKAHRVDANGSVWVVRGPGLLDATNKVLITSRIQGRLTKVDAQRNDVILKGFMLAQLDVEDLKSQLVAARADLEAASEAVSVAQSNVTRASAASSKLLADMDRRQKLLTSGAVSRAEVDALDSTIRQAQAELQGAVLSVRRAEAQRQSADANVSLLESRVDEGTVRSPLSGVVVSRDKNVGDIVGLGSSIMQLVEPASLIISARFDESSLSAVKAGMMATVNFVSSPRKEYHGRVQRIGRLVDQETREFTVDIGLDDLPENWALGQRASVSVSTDVSSVMPFVPQHYVRREDGKTGVWVLRNSRAYWQTVRLGFSSGPLVEIVEGVRHSDVVLEPIGRYTFELVAASLSWE